MALDYKRTLGELSIKSCLYITKYLKTVIVLHSFMKITNGVDRKAMVVAQPRLKELKQMINKLKG